MNVANDLLDTIFSWTFVIPFILGYSARHIYCRIRARWLDKHRPNGDGAPHRVPVPNRIWLGGLLGLAAVGWSMYSVDQTAHRTDQIITDARAFSLEVRDCQRQFNTAIRWQRQLDQDNSDLAAEDRKALADWLAALVAPTDPDIAKLQTNDPIRQAWALAVTVDYQKRQSAIEQQREANNRTKAAHPLPEPTCGKDK